MHGLPQVSKSHYAWQRLNVSGRHMQRISAGAGTGTLRSRTESGAGAN